MVVLGVSCSYELAICLVCRLTEEIETGVSSCFFDADFKFFTKPGDIGSARDERDSEGVSKFCAFLEF